MKRMGMRKIANRISVILFCLILFFYTMAFPGNTSWFILIFFVLLFALVFLSTVFSFGKTEAFLSNHTNYTKDLQVSMYTRLGLPILLPNLTVRLKLKEKTLEQTVWIYFRNRIQLRFEGISLPRGHYTEIEAETFGKDHFNFFTHYSKKKIPVSFEIYPEPYAPKYRYYLFQKLMVNPYLKRYLKSNAAEFRQIRDYIPQDAMKHIDWKSSARKRKLMVKEYEKEIQPTITIVFFGYQSPAFEHLLRLAYTLYQTLKENIEIRFVLIGQFHGETEHKEDLFSFLTVEPSNEKEKMMDFWRKIRVPQGYVIAVASDQMVDQLKQQRAEQAIYFSETDLVEMEVTPPL